MLKIRISEIQDFGNYGFYLKDGPHNLLCLHHTSGSMFNTCQSQSSHRSILKKLRYAA